MNNQDTRRLSDSLLQNGSSQYKVGAEIKSNDVAVNAVYAIFTQLHKLRSLRRSFLHFHFISAVHIWFISYIINTLFFHGNLWTHNWPAPNVSGFIAQLVEHRIGIARSRAQTPLKSWIFFFKASLRNCINCAHCDDHFFTFISFPHFRRWYMIYFMYH